MNKYRILVTAILIITMTFVYIPAFGVEEEPETKYHLDMGVWSIPQVTCPPKVAPVSKLVINWYTDFERMGKLWQGKTIRWSRSS